MKTDQEILKRLCQFVRGKLTLREGYFATYTLGQEYVSILADYARFNPFNLDYEFEWMISLYNKGWKSEDFKIVDATDRDELVKNFVASFKKK